MSIQNPRSSQSIYSPADPAAQPAITEATSRARSRVREEIPAEYKWDLTRLYAGWVAWDDALVELECKQEAFAGLKGTLAGGPEALLFAERLADEIAVLAGRIGRYVQFSRDTDSRDNEVGARLQRFQNAVHRFRTATSWYRPELLGISLQTIGSWFESTPDLRTFRFGIEEQFRLAEHTLDEVQETLLSYSGSLTQSPASIFRDLSTSDVRHPKIRLSTGEEVTLSHGRLLQIQQQNRNQADRRLSVRTSQEHLNANRNTYASIYNAVLQRDWFLARARRYASSAEAALARNNVPLAVLESLVTSVRTATEPVRRYHRLRKDRLRLERYDLYDTMIPLVEHAGSYAYGDMRELITASAEPLGAEYQRRLDQRFDGRWMDVYENDGKRSGAYSSGVYGVGPFVLMNYSDTLRDVFTLAHELGHSMHTVLAHEAQPHATAYYTIFVAEVASTLNEALLLQTMLQRSRDPRERIALLQHQIDGTISTFYAQVLFADFEWTAHRMVEAGEPVTADGLCQLYQDLLRRYWGEAFELDPLYGTTWMRISHFFDVPFYVYQYATSYAASAQIARTILNGTAGDREALVSRYLELLRSGGSDHPMDQLLGAGVDLRTPEPFLAVTERLDDLVTRLEQELNDLT